MKPLFPLVIASLLAALLAGCQPMEKGTKMAVINTKEVLTKCNAGIRIVEEIQKQFADRREALKDQEQAIQKLRQDPELANAKSGKKEELQALTRQFLTESQQLRKDVGETEAAKFKPLVDKINKALREYAEEQGIAGVQDKGGFAYINPDIDITAAIIKRVDQMP